MGRPLKDLTGKKFGRLLVLDHYDRLGEKHRWLCRCDCGNVVPIAGSDLKRKRWSKSCGCILSESLYGRNGIHGLSGTPELRMFNGAKHRAKKRNLEFNIEVSDINIPEVCPILGTKIEHGKLGNDTGPSLDRIDNALGYVKGNVWVVSRRANRIKSDATLDELEKIVAAMKRICG